MHKHPDQEKSPPRKSGKEPVEGEGSYTGTRRYDAGVREFVKSGAVDPAAKEARRAVDEDGEALKQAEDKARRR